MIQRISEWLRDPEIVKAWGPVIVGMCAIFASFLASLGLLWTQRRQNKMQNLANLRNYSIAKSKEERDEIIKKLNSFYGPFKALRTQSRLLYGKFALAIQQSDKASGVRFRTLRHLLEGKTFVGQDKELLAQILQINSELRKLIESSSGVVDRPELQDLLGKLGTHIRVLQLASERKLSGPPSAFDDIVFPLPIDGALESAILRLQDRLRELGSDEIKPSTTDAPLKARNATIRYYDENADQYARQTMFLDLKHLYDPFLQQLPRGSRILDAGCGVGRDTRHFIEHGYIVVSFDASTEMVRKCREYPHAYCIKATFDGIQFKEEFDGVWACASILHLTRHEATDAVLRLSSALKPGGVLFLSLKEGEGHRTSEGRYFEYYSEKNVSDLYQRQGLLELLRLWKSTGTNGCDQADWLNLLLKRKIHAF
jgi:2-polyprenyl-3-methyl-5-hydroxy-6-metoxy-1,4-benzoquinol methylase